LSFGWACGNDEAAGFFELGKDGGGEFGGGGGDKDGVIGGLVGEAEGTVGDEEGDVAVVEAVEDQLGLRGQCGVALDGIDVAGEFGEEGGLVSGAGADFEDGIVGVEAEEFEHEGDDVGLGDGLGFGDGERGVVVSVVAVGEADKFVAGDLGHDGEDAGVLDAALGELGSDHALAESGEIEVGAGHGVPLLASSFWLLAGAIVAVGRRRGYDERGWVAVISVRLWLRMAASASAAEAAISSWVLWLG